MPLSFAFFHMAIETACGVALCLPSGPDKASKNAVCMTGLQSSGDNRGAPQSQVMSLSSSSKQTALCCSCFMQRGLVQMGMWCRLRAHHHEWPPTIVRHHDGLDLRNTAGQLIIARA